MAEVWRNIKGYDGLYQASSEGRCRNAKTGRIIMGCSDKDGYLKTILTNQFGKTCDERIHRLVALAFCDKPENHNVVNHKNMVKNDNRAENLEWSTVQKNTKHAYDNCKAIRDKTYLASLAGAEVSTITIDVFKNGEYVGRFKGKEKCAIELGISPKTIYNGINGRYGSRNGYEFKKVGDASADNIK